MFLKQDKNNFAQYGLDYLFAEESYAGYYCDRFAVPELLRIQNAAEQESIHVLFFFFFVEKYDTYKPLHLNREQCDTDILVSAKDAWRLCRICKDLGFMPLSGVVDEQWFETSISDLSRHHLPALRKNIIHDTIFITVEIHVVLTPMWNTLPDRNEYVNDILKYRCIPNEKLGLYGMSVTDRFIFSFLYFTNDFLSSMLTFYYCPNERLLNCKTLADAYLLLTKYHKQLDTELIVQRIHTFGLECNALFSVSIMRGLFDVRQFDELLTHIQRRCLHFLQGKTLSFANKVLYSAYAVSDELFACAEYSEITFYKKVLSRCISMNETLYAPKSQKTAFHLHGRLPTTSYFFWDDRAMTIHIEIPKSELLYRQEDAIRYDGINLRFYNPDYCLEKDNAVRNVFVCFRKKENREEEADITFNGTDPTLRGTLPANGIKVHSERNGNLYRVDITIPWSVQGFIPAVCSHIGFECTLSLYNDGKHELAYWSNGTVPHYNPAKFGKIFLIRP